MPLPFRPNCQPTSLGLLPHDDAAAAWDAILRTTPALPALPVLAGNGESMAFVAASGFAGVGVGNVEHVIDRAAALRGLDALYVAYLRGAYQTQSLELAALPRLLQAEPQLVRRMRAIFGLVLGPISLALTLVDDEAAPILDDAQLLDGVSKHLFLRRLWLSKTLERSGQPAILWLYEPYLNIIKSAFSPQSTDELISAVDQTLGYGMPRALWLTDTDILALLLDALSVDVLGMPLPPLEAAAPIGPLLRRLLAQKTAIGWGIVPVTAEGLAHSTVGRLAARFETWLRALEAAGVPPADMLAASLIMPEDTLTHLDAAHAERALALTAELSSLIRQSYGLD